MDSIGERETSQDMLMGNTTPAGKRRKTYAHAPTKPTKASKPNQCIATHQLAVKIRSLDSAIYQDYDELMDSLNSAVASNNLIPDLIKEYQRQAQLIIGENELKDTKFVQECTQAFHTRSEALRLALKHAENSDGQIESQSRLLYYKTKDFDNVNLRLTNTTQLAKIRAHANIRLEAKVSQMKADNEELQRLSVAKDDTHQEQLNGLNAAIAAKDDAYRQFQVSTAEKNEELQNKLKQVADENEELQSKLKQVADENEELQNKLKQVKDSKAVKDEGHRRLQISMASKIQELQNNERATQASKDKEVQRLQTTMVSRNEELQNILKAMMTSNDELQNSLKATRVPMDEDYQRLQTTMASRNEDLRNDLEATRISKDEDYQRLQTTMASRNEELQGDLEATMASKNELQDSLEATRISKDEDYQRLQTTMASRNEELQSELETALASKNDLQIDLQTITASKVELQNGLQAAMASSNEIQNDLNTVLASIMSDAQDSLMFEGVQSGEMVVVRAQRLRDRAFVVVESKDGRRTVWNDGLEKCLVHMFQWNWYLRLGTGEDIRFDDLDPYRLMALLKVP